MVEVYNKKEPTLKLEESKVPDNEPLPTEPCPRCKREYPVGHYCRCTAARIAYEYSPRVVAAVQKELEVWTRFALSNPRKK